MAAIVLGGLSFIAACAALLARFLQHDEIGSQPSIGSFRRLSDALWKAETVGAKLRLFLGRGDGLVASKEYRALVVEAEALAREIYGLVRTTGVGR